jgi:hypothetical protein
MLLVVIVTSRDSSRQRSRSVLVSRIGRQESSSMSCTRRCPPSSPPPSSSGRNHHLVIVSGGGEVGRLPPLSFSLSLVVGYCMTPSLPTIIVTSCNSCPSAPSIISPPQNNGWLLCRLLPLACYVVSVQSRRRPPPAAAPRSFNSRSIHSMFDPFHRQRIFTGRQCLR